MSIKISELSPQVTTLADLDLFAVADYSEGTTVSISFDSLKNIIVDQDTFTNNASLVVNALNVYRSPITGFNELQATTLQSLDANTGIITPVDLTYILNYQNHTNTPFIPTDLHELNNFQAGDSGGYVRFRTTTTGSGGEMVYQPKQNGVVTAGQVITTDFIIEGNNLYYNDDRVEDFLDANFGEYYNSFAATFDEGNVKDSYIDTIGEFILPLVTDSETSIIRVRREAEIPGSAGEIRAQQNQRFLGYREGQRLRIFGANPANTGQISVTNTTYSLDIVGFRSEVRVGDSGPDRPHLGFSYRVCEWSLETGQMTVATPAQECWIGVPEAITSDNEIAEFDEKALLDAFGVENFIELDFSNLPEGGNRGLLIWRRYLGAYASANTESQIAGAGGSHELIAVLGPKEVNASAWQDYYSDDILAYNKKFQTVEGGYANRYLPENTVLFRPKEEPSAARKGWVDRTIREVRFQNPNSISTSEYIDIYLDDVVTGETAGCWLAHNDTSKIQQAINFNATNGRKAIQLNPKNYVVTELTIPNDFGINGFAYNTSMTRMPWAGYGDRPSSKILRASSGVPQNISLVGFDVDGNAINQVLFDDATDEPRNYAFDFGDGGDSILLDKVRLRNMIGGGIYCNNGANFKMFASECKDSGLTDRHLYSPLIVQGGENTSIVSNRFENFTENVNVSVTNKGVIEGNIIVACGSGLLTYGSRFLIAAPNILVGPADEFLPNPDAFNSEYDSINLDLSTSITDTGFTQFQSDRFKYQENGELYNLVGSQLGYKFYGIAKNEDTGLETQWCFIDNAPGYLEMYRDDTTDNPLEQGGFGFTIPSDSVERMRFTAGRYTNVLLQDPGSGFANGDTITISGIYMGGTNLVNDVQVTVDVANTATGGIEAFSFTGQQSIVQSKTYTGIDDGDWVTDGSGTGAVFTVVANGGVYTTEFMLDPNNQIPLGPGLTVAGNPRHIGLGWLAAVTQFVESADIINTSAEDDRGTWTVPYESPVGSGEYYADYTLRIENYENVSNTTIVTPQSAGVYTHLGFSAGSTYIGPGGVEHEPEPYGQIISDVNITETGRLIKEITIKWKWANYIDPVTGQTALGGYGGRLTSRRDVPIAVGRIK